MKTKLLKPSCVLCLSQKSLLGTGTFLWETPHVFHDGGIRLAPIFWFSYPILYAATGAAKPTNHTAGTLVNSVLSIARFHRGRPHPHQLRYLHVTWLIKIFPPNPSLVGLLFLFLAAIIGPRLALSGSPKGHNLRFSRLNRPCKYFLGWKL